jgi:hypothetical protein
MWRQKVYSYLLWDAKNSGFYGVNPNQRVGKMAHSHTKSCILCPRVCVFPPPAPPPPQCLVGIQTVVSWMARWLGLSWCGLLSGRQ